MNMIMRLPTHGDETNTNQITEEKYIKQKNTIETHKVISLSVPDPCSGNLEPSTRGFPEQG